MCRPLSGSWYTPAAQAGVRDQRRHAHVKREVEETMHRAVIVSVLLVWLATPVRAQDAEAGAKVFAQCRACHQVGEAAKNLVGPVLNGLFGRPAGTAPGYSYSPANQKSGITWDEATFAEYIKDPKAKIPGTKMIYAGLKDAKRIKDLTAFLKQFDKDGKKAN
jgi:cytochrome c